MRRRTFDILMAAAGMFLAVTLIVVRRDADLGP